MPADLLLFLFCSVVIVAAPRPANLRVLVRSLDQGRAAGLAAVLGIALGCLVHMLVAVAVAIALLRISPMAFDAGRLAGVAYLMWLAVRVLRHRAAFDLQEPPPRLAPWRIAARALWSTARNPGLLLFLVVFLPQFVNPWTGHLDVQMFQLGIGFTLLTAAVLAAAACCARPLHALLGRRPWAGEAVGWLAGLIYLLLALRAVWPG